MKAILAKLQKELMNKVSLSLGFFEMSQNKIRLQFYLKLREGGITLTSPF